VFDGAPGTVTARELSRAAHRLAQRIPEGLSSVLVQSSDPRLIAEYLLAAEIRDISLFLAHEHLAAEEVEAIAGEIRIGAVSISGGPLRVTGFPPACGGDPYVHLMTSGTTGSPKIARHSLASLLGRVERFVGDRNLQGARWLLTYAPATFAGVQVILTALATGGCLVVPQYRTVPCLRQAAAIYHPTHISGTPTFWRSFLLFPSAQEAFQHVRQITLGGEAADQRTLDRLRLTFPQARVTHIYASTEAGALFSVDDGLTGFPANWLEQPVSNVRLRIRDGELEVLSPRGMQGYASAHDAPFLDDGWLRTGDLVRREGDRIQFAGRVNATINVGGMKVQPLEVELRLLETEGVAEARAWGIASPITGQLVVAEIVVEPGMDPDQVVRAAAAHVRSRLAPHKAPRSIRVVDSIAASPTGKKLLLRASA
jgi:acyl-coenzyme A synthetase/AMP-(fatty) acid ligase